MSGDEALLKWVQAALEGADDVEISSFNEGWADGRALCAIISHVRPRKRKSVGWARQRGADLVGGVALVTGGVPDMLCFVRFSTEKMWLCPDRLSRRAARRVLLVAMPGLGRPHRGPALCLVVSGCRSLDMDGTGGEYPFVLFVFGVFYPGLFFVDRVAPVDLFSLGRGRVSWKWPGLFVGFRFLCARVRWRWISPIKFFLCFLPDVMAAKPLSCCIRCNELTLAEDG